MVQSNYGKLVKCSLNQVNAGCRLISSSGLLAADIMMMKYKSA